MAEPPFSRKDVEALRRAITVPREAMEAMRRVANVGLPPETVRALRRASSLPPGTAEALRRAATIPPETMEALRRAATIPPETMEAIRRAATLPPETMEAMRRAATEIELPRLSESVQRTMADIARTFQAAWEEAMPDNWVDLRIDEIVETIERVRVTGYTLVWIPHAEIVRDVLAAEASETEKVLLARRDDVLADAEACLADVTGGDLALLRSAVEEAVATLREGRPLAAQALASVAFTSEIHQMFGMGTKAGRKRMEGNDPMDFPLGELRLRTIFLAAARALAEFRPDTGRPTRREFNRHNSAHRLTPEQWTEANALSGIMLATALLREMQPWSDPTVP